MPKNDKKTKIQLKVQKIFILWNIFRENKSFLKSRYGSVKSSFDNIADSFLPKHNFSLKNLKKSRSKLRKVTKLFFFREINFTWRNGSRQIKEQFHNLLLFIARVRKKTTESLNTSFKTLIYPEDKVFFDKTLWKRRILFWQPCWSFSAKRPVFPQTSEKRNSPRDLGQIFDLFMFLARTKFSRKSSSRQLKGNFDFRLNV